MKEIGLGIIIGTLMVSLIKEKITIVNWLMLSIGLTLIIIKAIKEGAKESE